MVLPSCLLTGWLLEALLQLDSSHRRNYEHMVRKNVFQAHEERNNLLSGSSQNTAQRELFHGDGPSNI